MHGKGAYPASSWEYGTWINWIGSYEPNISTLNYPTNQNQTDKQHNAELATNLVLGSSVLFVVGGLAGSLPWKEGYSGRRVPHIQITGTHLCSKIPTPLWSTNCLLIADIVE